MNTENSNRVTGRDRREQRSQFKNQHYHHHHKGGSPSMVIITAVALIGAGAVLLLNSMGFIPENIHHILISWPMLLILIGTVGIFRRDHNFGTWIIFSIGVFFLIPRIWDITDYTVTFWPLILIFLGILLLTRFNEFRRRVREATVSENQGSDDFFDDVNIFGGGERIYTSQNFRGGKITSIFGGSEIDLTKAKLAPGTNVIEVAYIFGGSTIVVPPTWTLRIETTAIFGSITDKRNIIHNPEQDNDSILVIKGAAIFGGGEIKSY